MYSRDEAKALTDKVLNMAGGDAEVDLSGGERSGTRWANSSITTNLIQYDRNLSVTVYTGGKSGSSGTRDFSDAGLKMMVDEAKANAAQSTAQVTPDLLGPQTYVPVDAALPAMINFGPGERARMVKASIDICEKKGVLGAGYIPKTDQTNVVANSKGLFSYYRYAESGFVLTCRMADGGGSGWGGITGVKDLGLIDAAHITEVASEKALKSRKPKALEPGRYTTILEPRANARFLSLMTGIFNQAPPAAGAAGAAAPAGRGGRGGGGRGGGGRGGRGGQDVRNIGDKIFSEQFSLKSDIGNNILRQTPILGNNRPAKSVQWVEKGVLKNFAGPDAGANVNMSLVQEGTNLSIEDMIKQTRRGLLVTFFWYIRGVPAEGQPLLNTGMTRDGLFLIENGEITGPVQNFRWNMSPLVGYSNLSLVGKSVPIHMGEAYDGPGSALVPPVRIEDFYMTSVSPAVSP